MYGRYQRDWYQAIYRFVSQVVAEVSPGTFTSPAGRTRFAWLPGSGQRRDFPARHAGSPSPATSASSARSTPPTITATPRFPCKAPWRIRVPLPDWLRPSSLNLEDLVSPEDFFRAQLFFLCSFVLRFRMLRDVDYGFRSTRTAGAAADSSQSGQARCDLAGHDLPASAVSIEPGSISRRQHLNQIT